MCLLVMLGFLLVLVMLRVIRLVVFGGRVETADIRVHVRVIGVFQDMHLMLVMSVFFLRMFRSASRDLRFEAVAQIASILG